MKNLCVLLLITIFVGCDKMEEIPSDVTVKININGFNITTDDFGTLKGVSADVFDNFQHKYAGGVLNFTAPSGAVYTFNTNTESVAGFVFSITPGTYQLTGNAGVPSETGSSTMAFTILQQEFVINETTTVLDITITPTCGLLLVADESLLVQSAVIRRIDDPYTEWPLITDGIYYYTYFVPRSSRHATITKTDGSSLDMSTNLLKVGYIYKVEVTDGTGTTRVNLNPTFENGEVIVY